MDSHVLVYSSLVDLEGGGVGSRKGTVLQFLRRSQQRYMHAMCICTYLEDSISFFPGCFGFIFIGLCKSIFVMINVKLNLERKIRLLIISLNPIPYADPISKTDAVINEAYILEILKQSVRSGKALKRHLGKPQKAPTLMARP